MAKNFTEYFDNLQFLLFDYNANNVYNLELSYTCRMRGQKLNQKISYAVQGLISKTIAVISCLINGINGINGINCINKIHIN